MVETSGFHTKLVADSLNLLIYFIIYFDGFFVDKWGIPFN